MLNACQIKPKLNLWQGFTMEIHFWWTGAVIFLFGLWVISFKPVWFCWSFFHFQIGSLWKVQNCCGNTHSPFWPLSMFYAVCLAAAEHSRKELENEVLQITFSFVRFTPAYTLVVYGHLAYQPPISWLCVQGNGASISRCLEAQRLLVQHQLSV